MGPAGKAFCVTEMGLLQPSTLNTQITDLTLLFLIPSIQKPGCGTAVLSTVPKIPHDGVTTSFCQGGSRPADVRQAGS